MATFRGGRVVSNTPRPVTDEPVRGAVPPAWVFGLPGIERMRLYARSLIPANPMTRLFGMAVGHLSAGSFTARMKASPHTTFLPALNVIPLFIDSMNGAALTAVDPGFRVDLIAYSSQYYRNPRPQPGNFLGRARILNTSTVFVATAADIEDPVGRLVGHSIAQWAINKVEPPPPAQPATIERIEEPTYPSPDPPDRPPVGGLPPAEMQARFSGLQLARMLVAGELPPLPAMNTMGIRWEVADEGTSRLSMPASEWFCSFTRDVAPSAIASLITPAAVAAVVTLWAPGQSVAILEMTSRFLRSVPADGQQLTAQARVTNRAGNLVFAQAEAVDVGGNVVAAASGSFALLDPRDTRPSEPERILATLLFTDIVGSTQHAERIGDAAWRSLLGEHHELVRQELGAHRGREVNTIGDGFLARFESPASAIRCAKAIRDGVKRLHWRSAQPSTPVSARCTERTSPASPCTSERGSARSRARTKSLSPKPCATSRPGLSFGSLHVVLTRSRASRASGTSSRWNPDGETAADRFVGAARRDDPGAAGEGPIHRIANQEIPCVER